MNLTTDILGADRFPFQVDLFSHRAVMEHTVNIGDVMTAIERAGFFVAWGATSALTILPSSRSSPQ